MFEDYKNQLIEIYGDLCSKSELSNNLINPTPAKLKRECLIVYARVGKAIDDQRTLSDFFGQPDDFGSFENLIRRLDVDKFRPLNNFLLGKTTDPDERNVELLAWLLDFRPRPYKFENFIEAKPRPTDLRTTAKTTNENTEVPLVGHGHKFINTKVKNTFLGKWRFPIAGFALITVLVSSLFYVRNIKSDQQCMYWSNDHYVAIDCKKRIFGKQSIALDTLMLFHFKKITKPDTISNKSVGKIWYLKNDGKLEFFTAQGHHPTLTTKKLRPVTLYIIQKYVTEIPGKL